MVQHLTIETRDLDGFEDLQKAVKGTHFDVVQLGRGKLGGRIVHLGIDNLTLSVGVFSEGIRARRTCDDGQILLGMLLGAADRVTQWSFDMLPADVVVIPPRAEHHAVYADASSYAAMRLNPRELPRVFGGISWLSDPDNWRENKCYRASDIGTAAARRLSLVADHLARHEGDLSEDAAEFWKRTIVECMAVTISTSIPTDDGCHLASATKLVRSVEDYLQAKGERLQHISQICFELGVSRRSLHRAFHEVFGIGPLTFLRQKRLCAVHSLLKQGSSETTTVAQVAIEHGFVELGRFSQYYRAMFGETPSQTLAGRADSARVGDGGHDLAAKALRERSKFSRPINADSSVQSFS